MAHAAPRTVPTVVDEPVTQETADLVLGNPTAIAGSSEGNENNANKRKARDDDDATDDEASPKTPMMKSKEQEAEDETLVCCICISNTDNNITTPCCNKPVHGLCILSYLHHNGLSYDMNCPCCRSPLVIAPEYYNCHHSKYMHDFHRRLSVGSDDPNFANKDVRAMGIPAKYYDQLFDETYRQRLRSYEHFLKTLESYESR